MRSFLGDLRLYAVEVGLKLCGGHAHGKARVHLATGGKRVVH